MRLRLPIPNPPLALGLRISLAHAAIVLCLSAVSQTAARAQPTPAPPAQDPLLTLMLSQPRIDVTTPVAPVTAFDPPVVRPGERAIYRVTLNALEPSIEWSGQPPVVTNLNLRPGGHGQVFQMGGGALQPRTSYNFHTVAGPPGSYVVPAFEVMVYGKTVTVPAAELRVVAPGPAATEPAQLLGFELAETNLYVGQPVRAHVLLSGSSNGVVQALTAVQFVGQGVIADQTAARQRVEVIPRRGPGLANGAVATYTYETWVTPIASGRIPVFAQGFAVGNRFSGTIVISGPATIPGGPPQYTLLDSDPIELHVRPLPTEGRQPGFRGAVGSFVVDLPTLATNLLQAGEPVQLAVRIHGEGNLTRLIPPLPPKSEDWQILAASGDNPPAQIAQAQGFIMFKYTLVPLKEGLEATPAIPFSAFDPARGAYVDLSIQPVPVTVEPGATPGDFHTFAAADSITEEPEKEPALGALSRTPALAGSLVPIQGEAWFPLIQLAPALAFVGLWGWDRRRRYLEAHPDVVIRRRARRELRRHKRALRHALQRADAPAFAAATVNAFRVACAPRFPAEARALVGADVSAALPPEERVGSGGRAVKTVFAFNDAAQFSDQEADPDKILSHAPELERVLTLLEAQL